MFDTKDILARLQNGETIESIAAEMTVALNEANEAYEAANAKATRNAVLESAAANLVSSLLDYTNIVYPELVADVTEEDEAAIAALLVNEADNLTKLAKLAISFGVFDEPKICCGKADAKCACKADINKKMSAEDVLNEFLKKNFLS